ncbi:MAG: hypothetical protein JWO56_1396, partial [Acidobacteria bacterium]|nr:hypothetical protein [Acidobacteriota bacterium]
MTELTTANCPPPALPPDVDPAAELLAVAKIGVPLVASMLYRLVELGELVNNGPTDHFLNRLRRAVEHVEEAAANFSDPIAAPPTIPESGVRSAITRVPASARPIAPPVSKRERRKSVVVSKEFDNATPNRRVPFDSASGPLIGLDGEPIRIEYVDHEFAKKYDDIITGSRDLRRPEGFVSRDPRSAAALVAEDCSHLIPIL